jgi:hypothetical protein
MAPVKKENCSGILITKFCLKNTHKFGINLKKEMKVGSQSKIPDSFSGI